MLLGLALVCLSPFANYVAPPRAGWTEEDGALREKASADFHAASYNLPQSDDSGATSGGKEPRYDPIEAKAKYLAAKQEYEAQTARLATVQSRQVWLVWGVRFAGVFLVLIGVGGYFQAQGSRRE